MLSIFMIFFYLVIFVFVAGVIARNVMNIKNISERFKTMYETEGKEGLYKYMSQNQTQPQKQQDNVNFESTIELNNNPIKEKKGKRSSI